MHVKAKSAADQWLNTDYIKPHAPRRGAGSPAFRLPRNPQQASEMGSAGPTKSQPTHSVFLQTAAVTLHLTKTGAWKFITAWCPSAARSSGPHRDVVILLRQGTLSWGNWSHKWLGWATWVPQLPQARQDRCEERKEATHCKAHSGYLLLVDRRKRWTPGPPGGKPLG